MAADIDVAEVTRLATTIDRWSGEMLAYFRTGRASNGPVEAINGELEAVDRTARGFRNFDHYRTRMLLKTAVDCKLPPHQNSGAVPLKANPPPPSSSLGPVIGELSPVITV
ncbi:MAG: transposase [Actinomycetota bacterium]|nr:transposase [Actinomycetota bacterium]